jgi:hypothetical protein
MLEFLIDNILFAFLFSRLPLTAAIVGEGL